MWIRIKFIFNIEVSVYAPCMFVRLPLTLVAMLFAFKARNIRNNTLVWIFRPVVCWTNVNIKYCATYFILVGVLISSMTKYLSYAVVDYKLWKHLRCFCHVPMNNVSVHLNERHLVGGQNSSGFNSSLFILALPSHAYARYFG